LKLLRRLARAAGFELLPLRKAREPLRRLVNLLELCRVDLVVDGGANRGQYARLLRELGWRGPILSIEPIPELRAELLRRATADPAWRIAPAVALGAEPGRAVLEISAETDMSSLLPRTPRLERLSPSSRPVRRIEVPVVRLDGLPGLVDAPAQRIFLKLDLQGFEGPALEGARGILPRVVGLQLELALVPLYQGELGWRSMLDRVEAMGYVPWLFLPGYVDPRSGRELQMDGVFVRAEAVGEHGRE
jgi:FkbM family methyltransferase